MGLGFNRDNVVLTPTIGGVAITVLTASKNSDAIDIGRFIEAIVFLNQTAHSGTNPTLDCKVQYSPDYNPTTGAGTWMDSADAFTQITTGDTLVIKKLTANFGKWIRLVFTLTGTNPNYTVKPYVVAKQ